MPTFVFFQSGKELARLQGASKDPIEQTIKKFYKDTPTKDAGYVSRIDGFLFDCEGEVFFRQISRHLLKRKVVRL